jgi:hypothetical protein
MSFPGYTGLSGAFGLGRETTGGAPASSLTYFPVLSNGIDINQTVNTLQPEIGGSHFLRGSYKAGVSGGGPINFYPRGDSMGHLFYALTGSYSETPVTGQTGAYNSLFTPLGPQANGTDLPYYTLMKDVSKLWANQFVDAKLNSLNIDIVKLSVITASANWFASTPSEVAVPGSETFDNSGDFVACQGSISFLDESTSLPFSSALSSNSIERITIAFNNNLATDEYVVGSYYTQGIALLQRTVSLTFDVIIRDKNLHEAIYNNGGSGAWSPTIKRAAVTVVLTSTTNIPGTTQPWQMTFTLPGIDLLMMPVAPSGAQLLRSTVTGQVTLGPSGSDTYSINLISSVAAY